jgi:hypothetical protein
MTAYNHMTTKYLTICSAPPCVLNEDEIEQFRCCCYKPLHKYGYYGCCHYTSSSTFKMSLSISPKWLFTCTYNVLYGSAVSFMRGKLKLLFLLGDNNGPISSITILKITYKLLWNFGLNRYLQRDSSQISNIRAVASRRGPPGLQQGKGQHS